MNWLIYIFLLLSCINLIGSLSSRDSRGEIFYYDIGCKPYILNNSNSSGSPDGFHCPNYEPNRCMYKGNLYKNGEFFLRNDKCHSCYCNVSQNIGTIFCKLPNCTRIKPGPGCFLLPGIDQCCSSQEVCRKKSKICHVDGVDYMEGDFFTPKDTCWNCLCREDFDGTYKKPYCQKITCNAEIWYQNEVVNKCAPVYTKDNTPCCPLSYVCDKGITSLIVLSRGDPSSSKGISCSLGKQQFNKNDKFFITFEDKVQFEQNATCICDLPPYPTCFNE